MNFRQITPFIILMTFIAIMLQVGCDTLVTENNTNYLVDSTLGIACFDCHKDTDNLLIRPKEQFKNSAHANDSLLDIAFDIGTISCKKCHTHEGFLKEIDSSITSSPSAYNSITCYTCHLPHTGEYGKWDIDSLRARNKVDFVSFSAINLGADFGKSNLCGHCHSATQWLDKNATNIILDENFGPHISPQADITSGKNGYFYDIGGVNPDTSNSHFANGCIKCHYGSSGDGQGYTYAEHTFRLEDKNTLQQYKTTCITSGCHVEADPEVIDFYLNPAISHIDTLSDSVKSLLDSYDIIDYSADSTGLTYAVGDTVPRIFAEAYYNFLLYKNDGSHGIHNPKFVTSLLDSTIKHLDSLPPIGSFTVDNDTSCSNINLATVFTPHIKGDFDTLKWDFGDNTSTIVPTKTETPVTHIYTDTGTFSVTLTSVSIWTNDALEFETSSHVLQRSDLMIVDTYPIADFAIVDTLDIPILVDTTICVGDTLLFKNLSTHTASGLNAWYFGYGDVVFASGDTSKVFDTIGTLDIGLFVETRCGVDDMTKLGYVTVEGAYIAFSSVDTNVCLGDTVTIINNSENNIPGIYTFNFGVVDTAEVVLDTFRLVYNTPGIYSVGLDFVSEAPSFCGTQSLTKPNFITIDGAKALFANLGQNDSTYIFTNNAIGNIDSLKWDFEGNGVHDTTTAKQISHTYTTGIYNATLIVYNANCSIIDSAVSVITVP